MKFTVTYNYRDGENSSVKIGSMQVEATDIPDAYEIAYDTLNDQVLDKTIFTFNVCGLTAVS